MAILAAFEEEELDRLYTDVAVGGPAFETGIVGNPLGVQQRNINNYDYTASYEIQFGGLSQAERRALEEFFKMKWGRAIGFRFYPPTDREFQNDVIGVGDGTADTFYMRRNYRSRTRFQSRRIVKPVKDMVTVTLDGSKLWILDPVFGGYVPAGSYPVIDPGTQFITVDWDTGAVQFFPAPAAGTIVRCAEGEYDIPVYFDVDAFEATDYGPFADWNSIKVVEILPSQITSLGAALTPLSLAFTVPHANEFKGAAFDVSLSHTGVSKVYLYIDGVLFGSDTVAPFTFTAVDPPLTPTGTFRLSALGVDGSGNFVEAAIDLGTTVGDASDTTPPLPPDSLTLTALSSTSIRATWSAALDPTEIDTLAPYPPMSLTVDPLSTTSLRATWIAATDATGTPGGTVVTQNTEPVTSGGVEVTQT